MVSKKASMWSNILASQSKFELQKLNEQQYYPYRGSATSCYIDPEYSWRYSNLQEMLTMSTNSSICFNHFIPVFSSLFLLQSIPFFYTAFGIRRVKLITPFLQIVPMMVTAIPLIEGILAFAGVLFLDLPKFLWICMLRPVCQ